MNHDNMQQKNTLHNIIILWIVCNKKKPLLLNEVIGDDQNGKDGAKEQAKHSVVKSLVVQLGGFIVLF